MTLLSSSSSSLMLPSIPDMMEAMSWRGKGGGGGGDVGGSCENDKWCNDGYKMGVGWLAL